MPQDKSTFDKYVEQMAIKREQLIEELTKINRVSLDEAVIINRAVQALNKGLTQRLELPKDIAAIENKVVSEFNTDLFWLLRTMEKRLPKDTNISRLNKLMSAAKSVQHDVLMKSAGEHLFYNGEKVFNRTAMNLTVDVIDNAVTKSSEVEKSNSVAAPTKSAEELEKEKNIQFAKELFNTAKTEAEKMTPEEREIIYCRIENMIYGFLKFSHFETIKNTMDSIEKNATKN